MKARWDDIDLDNGRWVVPISSQKLSRAQQKRARDFVVPLSPQAVNLFRQMKVNGWSNSFVMPSRHGKASISANALYLRLKAMLQKSDLSPFTLHDLRRTCRTHLTQSLRVPVHIAERCLNHKIGGIVDVYDTGDYLKERREALERWADYMDMVVKEGSKVRELRA